MRDLLHRSWGGRGRNFPSRRTREERFGCLGRQVLGEREKAILGRGAHVEPVGRHADRQQRIVVERREQRRLRRPRLGGVGNDEVERRGRRDLLDPLAHLDDLDRAGARMRLDPPPLGPGIGVVVMIDIGDQHRLAGLVDDQPDVAVDPRRPEVRVLALVDPVQLETVAARVHLQVEHARLDRLLVVPDSRLNAAVKVSAMRKFMRKA